MELSVLNLFKVGIGPSSSHTVGPMLAAYEFLSKVQDQSETVKNMNEIHCALHGSLGATGKGHGSGKAVILGLMGMRPDNVDVDQIDDLLNELTHTGCLKLGLGLSPINFDARIHIRFFVKPLPYHPNTLSFSVLNKKKEVLAAKTYISLGGGYIKEIPNDEYTEASVLENDQLSRGNGLSNGSVGLPFKTANELLDLARTNRQKISEVMRSHETRWRTTADLDIELLKLWSVMQACIWRGCRSPGILPGPLRVKRRAPELYRQLNQGSDGDVFDPSDPLKTLDWVNLFALAVNEENAAGGRVVTAPTNGAAGIIPAVISYYVHFVPGAKEEKIPDFLLTASAIGFLYKLNASISGAEVGCQGEVGVACSMAAGALCEILGGSPEQVENAAEIAMEHHLGLTCDPVGGLVQIPCIERNAIGSVKAINAARMALRGDGQHRVSLDKVIKTMRETGEDMKTKYKETARGGLALNVVEC